MTSSADVLRLAQDSVLSRPEDARVVAAGIETAHNDVYWPLILNLRNKISELQTPQTPISKIAVASALKVRKHDPDTSWEAAISQAPEASQRLYKAIYRLLTVLGSQTDDELREQLRIRNFPFSYSGVTKRRGELVDHGWVKATTARRKSESGKNMTVWKAVPDLTTK